MASERYCAPCDRRMIEDSQRHAHELAAVDNDHRAFALRWRGLEWSTIVTRLGMTSESVALRSANRYAKRHGLRLP